jgi:hypothetical protein
VTEQHVPLVLVGNALSLMVAATRLAQGGADVTIVNDGKNWGGHFTTTTCKGVPFDPGMVVYEFTSYNAQREDEDPRTYDPSVRNDAGRFCKTVRDYVSAYQLTHDITTPKMYVDGAVFDDILIGNALSVLRQLPFAEQVESELVATLNRSLASPFHASHKHQGDDFKKLTYEAASLANHGLTFHSSLIEPFCRKLFNGPTSDVLALYHRVAWLPLFYPETLLSYLQGSPQRLPPTVFSYPVGECIGDLANKLRTEIVNSERIRIVHERPIRVTATDNGTLELEFANQDKISGDQMAWANSLNELLRLLGLERYAATYQKCSIALAFLRIPTAALKFDFSVLSVVTPAVVTYRITNRTRCAGIESAFAQVVVEFNPDYAAAAEGSLAEAPMIDRVAEDLMALGVVTDVSQIECLELRRMNNVLMLPSEANKVGLAQEMNAALAAVPALSLLGPASGFFSSSLNDQVVQGLKLAALWARPA